MGYTPTIAGFPCLYSEIALNFPLSTSSRPPSPSASFIFGFQGPALEPVHYQGPSSERVF
eukprot:scaffold164303_cov32-Tisochrysis_lutea.AAC.3